MAEAAATPEATQGVRFRDVYNSGGSSRCSSSNINHRTPRPSRRYTPHHKTPASRRLRSQLSKSHARNVQNGSPASEALKELQSSAVKGLVKKTWKGYKVSPLYQFSHKSANLKRYSKLLSAYIAAATLKGIAVDVEKANSVTLSVLKGLKSSSDDPDAVEFVMKSQPRNGSEEGKVVLRGILCCVQQDPDVQHKIHKAFRVMPVLLCHGLVGLQRILIEWLQMEFDCCVNPLSFTSLELSWMVAMWAGYAPEKQGKSVELTYLTPQEVEGLTRIVMTIDPRHCKKLWDSIHEGESEDFYEEEVIRFRKSLEAHFHHYFRIYVDAMHLARVGTATAYVGSDGRLKIFSEDHVLQVLSHLTELATEQVIPS